MVELRFEFCMSALSKPFGALVGSGGFCLGFGLSHFKENSVRTCQKRATVRTIPKV